MNSSSDQRTNLESLVPNQKNSFRSVVVSTLLTMAGVSLISIVFAALFYEELLQYSRRFVDAFGGPGVALGFFVPDAFTVPVPNDAFSAFGWLGGMPFYKVLFWASLGSLSGGSFGWWFGKTVLHRSTKVQLFFERKGLVLGQKTKFERGSKLLLGLAALTPLPYSLACWSAGAVKMPYFTFLAISLLRIVRISLYLWLICQGFVTVVGRDSLY